MPMQDLLNYLASSPHGSSSLPVSTLRKFWFKTDTGEVLSIQAVNMVSALENIRRIYEGLKTFVAQCEKNGDIIKSLSK